MVYFLAWISMVLCVGNFACICMLFEHMINNKEGEIDAE